jgi:hypothetical protein
MRVSEGAAVQVTVRQSRSGKHHRRYWAVLTKIVEATDSYPSADHLHESLKFALGYVRPMRHLSGKLTFIPDSTAFDAMDQVEFNACYERAMAKLAEAFGVNPDELLEEA